MASPGAAAPPACPSRSYSPSQPPIITSAAKQHRSTIIMLHGLGDSGLGWADAAQQQGWAEALPHTSLIFPSAPVQPISRMGGALSTAWFDIPAITVAERQQDAVGMHDSRRYIEGLIQQQQAAGVPSERVLVGGFSQGAAIALLMLRSQLRLAGVLALSGFLPLPSEDTLVSGANVQTPVLVCHGDSDQMIMYERAERSAARLEAAGANFEFKTYAGMGHTTRGDEMRDVLRFLDRCLS